MKKFCSLKHIVVLSLCIAFSACSNNNTSQSDNTLTVSILPLKNIVELITEDDFNIRTIVPPGSSPETYELTASQIVEIANSHLVFTTGLIDFEKELVRRLSATENIHLVDLSAGIELIQGDCSHSHGHGHSHVHGIDPHIWLSTSSLKQITSNIHDKLMQLYPDSVKYTQNYAALIRKIDSVDEEIRDIITDNSVTKIFIYHPALTYYARDYDIEQISIEQEGKEPSVDKMQQIIDVARNNGLKKILYQKEFSRSVVETTAKDTGAEIIEIDPLAEDVLSNLLDITYQII